MECDVQLAQRIRGERNYNTDAQQFQSFTVALDSLNGVSEFDQDGNPNLSVAGIAKNIVNFSEAVSRLRSLSGRTFFR
jgi:hypothetical protein